MDIVTALEMLPAVLNLAVRLTTIVRTNTAMPVDEEIATLEAARMRSADDIITAVEAEIAKGKTAQ
ncbi:MAG: hypothetical protein LBQ00_06755 [Syntrophobacterales bacterium]|jgi:hypothetical protein|nr:hypothetical protein [Syntrophobacterales bacterium]